jgi:sulfatase modifying factor 1
MHGNVQEWCHDYYGEDYYQQSPEQDPPGPSSGLSRVLRGGSWDDTHNVGSAYRRGDIARVKFDFTRANHDNKTGFRVVRELD